MVRHRRQWVEQRSLQKLLVGGSVEVKKKSLLILYILYILRYSFIILLTHLQVMIICYDMLCLFLNIPHTSMVRPLFSPPGVPHNSLGTSCPIHACQLLALEGPPDGKCTSVRERQLQNGGLMLIFEKMPLSSNESSFCIR